MKRRSLIISIVALCLAAVCFVTTALAWLALGDNMSNVSFQIAKIDSNVRLFVAMDTNRNGIPDLTGEGSYDFVEIPNLVNNVISTLPTYALSFDPKGIVKYVQNFQNAQGGDQLVLVGETEENPATLSYNLWNNALPSQIFTYKLTLENLGDAANDIRITFASYPDDSGYKNYFNDSGNINNLRALSVAMGTRLVGGKLDGTSPVNGENIYNKIYFGNYVTSGGAWTDADLTEDMSVLIEGMLVAAVNPDSDLNQLEIWLQFCFEPYAVLKENVTNPNSVLITEVQYQALQGVSIVLPMLSVYFEVNVD